MGKILILEPADKLFVHIKDNHVLKVNKSSTPLCEGDYVSSIGYFTNFTEMVLDISLLWTGGKGEC